MSLLRCNIIRNHLTMETLPCVYNWGDVPPSAIPSQVDIVLAADCVYLEPSFPLLLKTLEDLIGQETVCYFCFKKRRKADMKFLKTLKRLFVVLEIDDAEQMQHKKDSIFLFVPIRCHALSNQLNLPDLPSGKEATYHRVHEVVKKLLIVLRILQVQAVCTQRKVQVVAKILSRDI